MKRVLSLLSLLLVLPASVMGEVDISGMTLDELHTLRNNIDARIEEITPTPTPAPSNGLPMLSSRNSSNRSTVSGSPVEIAGAEKAAPVVGLIYADGNFSESSSIEYEPYSFFDAKYNAETYKGTLVAMTGTVKTIYTESGYAAIFFDVDGRSSQRVFFFLEDEYAIANIHARDHLSITALATGDTYDLDMPVQYPTILPITIEII